MKEITPGAPSLHADFKAGLKRVKSDMPEVDRADALPHWQPLTEQALHRELGLL